MAADLTGIGTTVTGIKDILGMFFPDKTEEDKAKMVQAFQILQLQNTADQGQMAVNAAAAAKQPLTFRDGAGWVCVVGFAISFLKAPIEWAGVLFGHVVVLPVVDMSVLMPMLFGLLGLGAMHMNESIQTSK